LIQQPKPCLAWKFVEYVNPSTIELSIEEGDNNGQMALTISNCRSTIESKTPKICCRVTIT
jgi:hypothetical protein